MNHPEPLPNTKATFVGKNFGRFQLLKLIGKSERTMAWLVFDPRDQQELMLHLPRLAPVDDAALQQWQRNVQHALRLDHPYLAPGLEMGVHERWPFLVVERRRGVTLTEWLQNNPPPPLADVASWISQVLQGLAFVHDAGLQHGDLQLHSIAIDAQGAASVMAVATACATASATPDAVRNRQHAAERDVLACGLLLHQLLAGQPALDEPDTGRVINRLSPQGRDMVRLPWTTPHPVPEALRVIANRVTASQERQRYLNARTLQRALHGWIETEGQDRGGPLALLIDRLRSVGHLPAMPGVVARVERLALKESQHTDAIADEILQDMALSFELLRLVNGPQIQALQLGGAAPVLAMRRCVAMVGLNGVKQAAASLRRWPGPLSEEGAAAMDKTVQLVRLAALTAQRLGPPGYDGEVIYLITVLQNLGRLLVKYHFPEDAEQMRQLMLPAPTPAGGATAGAPQPGMSESAASLAVLGVDIDALGTAVARHWALGDEVLHMAHRLPTDRPVLTPDGDADMLRIVASAANEAVDAMSAPGTAPRKTMALSRVANRYARLLETDLPALQDALQQARLALQSGVAPAASRTAVKPAEPTSTNAGIKGTPSSLRPATS